MKVGSLSKINVKPKGRRIISETELKVVNKIISRIDEEISKSNLDIVKEFLLEISRTDAKILSYNGIFAIRRACALNYWECKFYSGNGHGGGSPGFWIGNSNS